MRHLQSAARRDQLQSLAMFSITLEQMLFVIHGCYYLECKSQWLVTNYGRPL